MTYDSLMTSTDPGPSGEALQESALAALCLLRDVQNRPALNLEAKAVSLAVAWFVLKDILTIAETLEVEEL